ncbi:MAG TPA: zf-HC2 domain-containing protein [Polyangiaceae bacterium]|nr:zf-HC2 domain-containing protein [Polyangiaceae bacterium]
MSDCQHTREQLLDAVRGRLAEPQRTHFDAHLQACSDCQHLFEREQALERALERRPRYTLPERLRESLTATATGAKADSGARRRRLGRLAAVLVPSLAAAALAVLLVRGPAGSGQPLIDEAINDHLRVLYAQHPIEIESGGIHQVKPWFAGKLDFAPVLQFSGDEEFPLEGGAIAVFVDRKAATFVFKHRLHLASLFVFRSQDLRFPSRAEQAIGSRTATSAASRGFNVLLWQDHDLGYALVSDMDQKSLARLAEKLTAP